MVKFQQNEKASLLGDLSLIIQTYRSIAEAISSNSEAVAALNKDTIKSEVIAAIEEEIKGDLTRIETGMDAKIMAVTANHAATNAKHLEFRLEQLEKLLLREDSSVSSNISQFSLSLLATLEADQDSPAYEENQASWTHV